MSDQFKFVIGDLVIFKTALYMFELECMEAPEVYAVLERIKQECSGGVQLHYVLSKFTKSMEFELISANDPEVKKVWDKSFKRYKELTK